jgi:hypothetical protein
MRSDYELYTPEMAHAERELDARIDHALGVVAEAEAKFEEFDQKMGTPEPPSDEDVERIKNYVTGHARTVEWQQVIERINRGQLTWHEVVEGLVNQTLDNEVSAAFQSLTRVPPASLETLIAIGVFPAEPPDEAEASDEEPDTAAENHGDDDHDDDMADEDWYGDPLGRGR